jgi:hypothetical protein
MFRSILFAVVFCLPFFGCKQQPPNRTIPQSEARQSEAPPPAPPTDSSLHLGQVVTVGGSGEGWPCGSSIGALQELMKWHKAASDKREYDFVMRELANTLMKTRSIMIAPGLHVRILDIGVGIRKVRVIEPLDKVWRKMTAARGCWVVSAALTQ